MVCPVTHRMLDPTRTSSPRGPPTFEDLHDPGPEPSGRAADRRAPGVPGGRVPPGVLPVSCRHPRAGPGRGARVLGRPRGGLVRGPAVADPRRAAHGARAAGARGVPGHRAGPDAVGAAGEIRRGAAGPARGRGAQRGGGGAGHLPARFSGGPVRPAGTVPAGGVLTGAAGHRAAHAGRGAPCHDPDPQRDQRRAGHPPAGRAALPHRGGAGSPGHPRLPGGRGCRAVRGAGLRHGRPVRAEPDGLRVRGSVRHRGHQRARGGRGGPAGGGDARRSRLPGPDGAVRRRLGPRRAARPRPAGGPAPHAEGGEPGGDRVLRGVPPGWPLHPAPGHHPG